MLLKQKQALIEWCDISGWNKPIALTLNLKQSVKTPVNGYMLVDKTYCEKQFCSYMRALNRYAYKSAYTRHNKRLRVIPIIEKSNNDRWHFHVAIEPPKHIDPETFEKIAMAMWLEMDCSYEHGQSKPDANNGWVEYGLKLRTKNGFEHYTDCIHLNALLK